MNAALPIRFVDLIRRKQLVAKGDCVLVAVSGGVDSIVLLHLFQRSAADLGIRVVAAHFDHAMRPGSAGDAAWLMDLCAQWGVDLIAERSSTVLRGEAAARAARYEFLLRAARAAGAQRIATAHHADDQIETIIFRLLRGSGLRGLSGIPIRRHNIIRPLLRFRKKTLEAYARAVGLEFREDETNALDVYARNRIRRTVIPVLRATRPSALRAILQLSRHAARTEKAWRSVTRAAGKNVILHSAAEGIELARGRLLEYDAGTRTRVLRAAFDHFGLRRDRAATYAAMSFVEKAASGARYDVGNGVRMERAYDVLRVFRSQTADSDRIVRVPDCGNGEAVAHIGGRQWRIEWTTSDSSDATAARFGCREVTFPLELRAWRPGDRLRMPYGTKKLKKLYAEQRVSVHERGAVPVLVDASGRVLWAVGVARSIEAPAADNAPVLSITVTNAEIS